MPLLKRFGTAWLRKRADGCLLSGLRHWLYRRSGLELGDGAFLNRGVVLVDDYENRVHFGARVAVAPGAMFVAVSHPNNSALSRVPRYCRQGDIVVRDDAWIGAAAVILPGLTVGRCSIVAAGAVVTRDVKDFEIVAGVPARPIGRTDADAPPAPAFGPVP